MIHVDEVRDRIAVTAPALAGRLAFAGDWSRVVQDQQLPPQSPWAYVLPGDIEGGEPDAMTGLFRQMWTEQVNVVLAVSYAGGAGGEAIDALAPLVEAVVVGLVGWGPDDAPGVWVLVRARVIGSRDSWVFFEITFALLNQLRVIPT